MGNKKNREFVGNLGTGADLLQKLAQDVYARGGGDEDLRLIISDDGLRGRLADLIVGERRIKTDIYTVAIDWSQSPKQMIASGRYDYVNEDINERNFPLSPPVQEDGSERSNRGETELELIYFDRRLTTAEVLDELDSRGLRPAVVWELLAFGERYPDVQRKFPVAALGSSWTDPSGDCHVPYLYDVSGHRRLNLRWGDPVDRWNDDYRFLAVRKSSSG